MPADIFGLRAVAFVRRYPRSVVQLSCLRFGVCPMRRTETSASQRARSHASTTRSSGSLTCTLRAQLPSMRTPCRSPGPTGPPHPTNRLDDASKPKPPIDYARTRAYAQQHIAPVDPKLYDELSDFEKGK